MAKKEAPDFSVSDEFEIYDLRIVNPEENVRLLQVNTNIPIKGCDN